MKNIDIKEDIKEEFKNLYSSGVPVREIVNTLNISIWNGFSLKRELKLDMKKWERVGLPFSFSDKTKQAIFGMLLGDGSIITKGQSIYHGLSISHSQKQYEYIKWKHALLKEIKVYDIKSAYDKWGTVRIVTPTHPYFSELKDKFYPNGIKTICNEWLEGLSDLSLAIWYMDDGSRNTGGYGCSIATCSFTRDELEMTCRYLKARWDLDIAIRCYDYNRLYLNTLNANKLKSIIESYIIPSMQYKVNFRPVKGDNTKC